jgi:hypothetical protein
MAIGDSEHCGQNADLLNEPLMHPKQNECPHLKTIGLTPFFPQIPQTAPSSPLTKIFGPDPKNALRTPSKFHSNWDTNIALITMYVLAIEIGSCVDSRILVKFSLLEPEK